MLTRLLSASDGAIYRELRIRMVREHPESFLASAEEEEANDATFYSRRIADSAQKGGGLLGAFADDRLVGAVGWLSEARAKARHKVQIWGMYVVQEHRRSGIGRRLLLEAIAHIAALPSAASVRLSVTEAAPAALALYLGLGFQSWGFEPDAVRVGDRSLAEHHLLLPLRPGHSGSDPQPVAES